MKPVPSCLTNGRNEVVLEFISRHSRTPVTDRKL